MSVLVEQYENLLISNLPAVRSIESGLRNVSWLLPGRFEDAELASEGCESRQCTMVTDYSSERPDESGVRVPRHTGRSTSRPKAIPPSAPFPPWSRCDDAAGEPDNAHDPV
jgi:peroxin-16